MANDIDIAGLLVTLFLGVLGSAITLFLGAVGLYFAHNISRQISLKIAEQRLAAYAELWSITEVASPTRLEFKELGSLVEPTPLTVLERQQLHQKTTSWYYAKGNGMLLEGSTRNMYLIVKRNLVCPLDKFEPSTFRERLKAVQDRSESEYIDERGRLSIRQLSLLRTRMKADLEIYGESYFGKYEAEDIEFLKYCGENIAQKPYTILNELNDPDPSVKIASIQALTGIVSSDTRVRNAILNKLNNDRDPNVKIAAMQALTGIVSSDAWVRNAIQKKLNNDPDPNVKIAAKQALGG